MSDDIPGNLVGCATNSSNPGPLADALAGSFIFRMKAKLTVISLINPLDKDTDAGGRCFSPV